MKRPALPDLLLRVGFFLALLLTIGFGLYPNLTLPEPTLTRGMTDIIYHITGFAVLSFIGSIAWRSVPGLPFHFSAGAVALELAQYFSPGRGVFLHDILASLTGVACGVSMLFLLRQMRRLWNGGEL